MPTGMKLSKGTHTEAGHSEAMGASSTTGKNAVVDPAHRDHAGEA
jgi:hypothetical protein